MKAKTPIQRINEILANIEKEYSKNSQDSRDLVRLAALCQMGHDVFLEMSTRAMMAENDDEVTYSAPPKEYLDTVEFILVGLRTLSFNDNKYIWQKE